MTYRGRVKNGVVVLEEPYSLPDGAEVEVALIPSVENPSEGKERTLNERLESVIGKAENLPPDAALNHDHYLYGLPKL